MSDKPAEQAYHARGAGRRQRLRELLYPKIADDKLIADWMWREIDRIDEGLREPGADTGTPATGEPEPLSTDFAEFVAMCQRHKARMSDGMSFIGSLAHWFNELAATQRAPVEQGRRLTKQQREELISAAHTLGDFTLETDHRAQELILLVESYMAAAPDHAREGALLGLVVNWRAKAKRNPIQCAWMDICADELERALANGKEGGE